MDIILRKFDVQQDSCQDRLQSHVLLVAGVQHVFQQVPGAKQFERRVVQGHVLVRRVHVVLLLEAYPSLEAVGLGWVHLGFHVLERLCLDSLQHVS